jgi:nucleotide-binding universal stress UspA family protein
MKDIIVPLDFSDDAVKGLELAILLSQKTPVKIQMVYVQRKAAEGIPSSAEEEYKQAERKFHKIIEYYSSKLGSDSQLTYIIKKGKVYQEIVAQAQAFPESVIVASTHGASGFEELFIGSNAHRIISATDRPVITIRKSPVPENIARIVLPINTTVNSRQKVIFTAHLAQIFGSEIHVVSVSSSHSKKIVSRLNAYSQQVINFLKSKELNYKSATLFGNNYTSMIIDYAESIHADLISMINESGGSLTDLIVSGTAQQMISKSSIPVLVIRAKEHFIKGSFSTFGE